MKIGGIQKSLCNLLWAVSEEYNITLYLFSKSGEYIDQLPPTVQVKTCTSLFRFLGVSQSECENRLSDRLTRGVLATLCKLFGRPFVMRLISLSQESLPEEYDVAISYLQNGNIHSFYGGINEFVLQKVHAKKKFLFCIVIMKIVELIILRTMHCTLLLIKSRLVQMDAAMRFFGSCRSWSKNVSP